MKSLTARHEVIRFERRLQGLTQEQLADRVSEIVGEPVAKSRIMDIERGRSKNAPLMALCEQALGLGAAPAPSSDLPAAEQTLLRSWRVLGGKSQRAMLAMLEHLVEMQGATQVMQGEYLRAREAERAGQLGDYPATGRAADKPQAARVTPIQPVQTEETRTLRLVGYVAARSSGSIVSLDERLDDEIEVIESRLPRRPKTLQALRVSGDSMAPEIPDGSVVIVAPTADRIQIGRLCVLQIDGEGGVLKRLKRWTRDEVTLESLNPDVPDVVVATKRLRGVRLKVVDVLKP